MSNLRTQIKNIHSLAGDLDGKLILAAYGEGIFPKNQHFKIDDYQQMTDVAEAWIQEDGRNIYMPLVVMRQDLEDGRKGGEADIVAVLGIVADFDRLSKTEKNQRNKNDLIAEEYWENLQNLLEIEEIKNIVAYANNFTVHAGNHKSISKLSEQETKTSIDKITQCHHALISVFKAIRMDFWDSEPFVAPVASRNIALNINTPLCDEMAQEETRKHIETIRDEYESIKYDDTIS